MAKTRGSAGFVDQGGSHRHAIAGTATDIAGFVGVTERGPTTATLVASWAEFGHTFGGFIDAAPFDTPYWRLPYAVRGFFENGGQRAYVARVLDAMAPAAPGDLAAVTGEQADPGHATGIAALVAVPDITLLAVPDDVVAPDFAAALVDGCDAARDRMAILDDVSGESTPSAHPDTSFATRYYPQLHVPAPHLPGSYAVVPPCGHVAGCLAAVAVASGAHGDATELAPASLIAAGHPSGVGPLERIVTRDEAERLSAHRVNTIRDFRIAGRGVRLWGIRTLSSDPVWQYVNVRRLGLFLERSIARGLQWVAVEPNSERTWRAVRAAVTTFLTARWRDGSFVGRTADEAFFARCDRTTMTQHDLDEGRLICLVGVAPVRPAEFVVIRIGLWTADKR